MPRVTVMTVKVTVYLGHGPPRFQTERANQHARTYGARNTENTYPRPMSRALKSRKAIQFDNRPTSDAVAEFRKLSSVDIRSRCFFARALSGR